jgi:hypothetical protein
MTAIAFRSPVVRPLHPSEWIRPAGSLDFRVTQQFNDPDFYWSRIDPARAALGHRATDIGQGRCGGALVAMAPGTVRRVKDNASQISPGATDALGIVVDHGYGITTEYWHLDAWVAADGARVGAGTQIGIVGDTGLGSICHCHIEGKRNGLKFDIEPHMFGKPLEVGGEEDDVKIRGAWRGHVTNRRAVLTSPSNFREGPSKADAILTTYPAGIGFLPTVEVGGLVVGGAPDAQVWYGGWLYEDTVGWQFGYLHSSVLTRTADGTAVAFTPVERLSAPGGYTKEQLSAAVAAARAAGRTEGIKAARDDLADLK